LGEINYVCADTYGFLHMCCNVLRVCVCVCVCVCADRYPSSSPDRAFRSLMYGLSLRMRSIRCFWSGKMSYSFLFSSEVSPGARCGGGEGEGERRGGCHSGGPEWDQCTLGWGNMEGRGRGVGAEGRTGGPGRKLAAAGRRAGGLGVSVGEG